MAELGSDNLGPRLYACLGLELGVSHCAPGKRERCRRRESFPAENIPWHKIISAQAIKRRRILAFPLPQTLPLQFRDFFNELLHLLITTHRLAKVFMPGFRNTDLTRFSLVLLDQIQGLVEHALSTATVGFAALARARVQGAAQEPFPRGELGDTRIRQ
jgi:hypothetical protein